MFIHLILELISLNVKTAQSASDANDDICSATELPAASASAPVPAPRRSERITRKPAPGGLLNRPRSPIAPQHLMCPYRPRAVQHL